jgi:uncharacterized GH25 family protein
MKRLFLTASLFAASVAVAHDTWLLPERFAAEPGVVAFELTSGMDFPQADGAIAPARVARAAYRVGGATAAITQLTEAEHALQVAASLPLAGVATVWIDLAPRVIDLEPDEVEEYLEEIGARDMVRQRWLATEGRRWREEYTKHAKTFVRMGGASDRSWSEPVGMFLEIVPGSDPTALAAGDALKVRVLRDGSSVSNLMLVLQRGDGDERQAQRTDGGGEATFALDAPGRWLLAGTWLRAAPGRDIDWESHFTTMTFDVAAARD